VIHPKFVRPLVKTNKYDWNDAAAICEAAQRPTMRFVAAKSLEQQDLLAIHRIRERPVSQRTGLCNQIRGLLVEYGIVLPQFISRLRRALPEVLEDGENELTVRGRELIASLFGIPGIGPIGATAVVATMGDPKASRTAATSRPSLDWFPGN
jgi:transposase